MQSIPPGWWAGPSLRKKEGAACSRVAKMEFISPTSTVNSHSRSLGACRRLLSPVSASRIAIAPASVMWTRHGILIRVFVVVFFDFLNTLPRVAWKAIGIRTLIWWIHQIYRIPHPIRQALRDHLKSSPR